MERKRDGSDTASQQCVRCGECCRIRGFVRVSAEEIDRIASFLGLVPRDVTNRFTRLAGNRHGLELRERDNGECVFLEGSDCAIQPVKPRQCRTFPDGWRYPGVEEICPAYVPLSGTPAGKPSMRPEIQNPKSKIQNKSQIPNDGLMDIH
jgi:Fe-S-cluster containining protein